MRLRHASVFVHELSPKGKKQVSRKEEQFESGIAAGGIDASFLAAQGEIRTSHDDTIARLRLLWDNRRLLARVFFWSVLASALVAFLIPNRYQATTQLMPPDNQSGTSMSLLSAISARPGAGSLGGIAGDLLGVKNSGALFVGILGSRTVQDRLIQEFDLGHVYHTQKVEDTREALAAHTAISEDRKSGIISISVTDTDPRRAAAMAQSYVEELDRLVAQVSTSSARRERIFLEERLHSVKQDLDSAAQKFSEFASKNTAIDIPAQGKAMVEAAARLQGELIAAESQLRGLQAIYTNENVRVRSLQARVAELESQLGKLGGDATNTALPSGNGPSSTTYPSIRRLPLLGVQYADLYRNTKIEETVFELLTQQSELAKVQEAKEIPSVKVLDAPVVPTKKVFPHRLILILVSVSVSLSLACLGLLASQVWLGVDPTDPRKEFVLEVVGAIHGNFAGLAPEGSFLRRLILRVWTPSGPSPTSQPENESVNENREKQAELSRTAGNGL
jgi:capsule polysaccharide export protein KpsE/RkpR